MNDLPSTPDTPDPFDRLVDGELSELERKELLTSLDQEPDGWRRCAMAFLEAQCWKKELGDLRQPAPASLPTAAPLTRPAKRRSSPFGLPGTLLAMAASFLLVLGAGILWQNSGNLRIAGPDQIAGRIGESSATLSPVTKTAGTSATGQPENAPWQWVQLSPAGSTDLEQTVQLPVIPRDRIDQQWLQSLPSSIPDGVVQALRRNGYDVQTQQQLMPMPLKDGRRLVVPVDKVEIQYVGNQTY